ncbi:helix-turn-helix transcriptional regulator [Myxosarcina sp. GI1]|uniref:helix-turn-helix transcriptional regulator n=1 Tax=Myxosarcina sp. GI1 TaxID=1541065 RepID=UPI00055BB266|nr:helix-turn-helix transcriptional regulator [Myxosarcina sp. GI1]
MKLSFAQWFKLRRDLADVTQAQVAKVLNVRPQTVSNWEKGVSKPSLNPEQTLKLCSILKISLEDLVKGFRGEVSIDD